MKKILLFCAACLLSVGIAYTCWYDDSGSYYPFLNTQNASISDPTLLLFVDYEAGLGLGYSDNATASTDGNVESWKKYLKDNASENDIVAVVYRMERPQLEGLLKNKATLATEAATNTIAKMWQKDKSLKTSMGNYLLYAKKCEEEATKANEWETDVIRDAAVMQKILEEGMQAAKKEKDLFIKRRYYFQVIRMAFYMQDNNTVVRLFDEYFGKDNNQDYTYFRALEVKAGAHHRKGDAEAPYYFAKVFANCPDRRVVCLNSFSFTSQENWERSIALCKTNEEKATFYAMRGLQPGANMVEELENIASVSPESPLLEVLLLRYLSEVQSAAFPIYLNEPSMYPNEEVSARFDLSRLKTLFNKLSENKNIKNRDFWILADAYTEVLNRNSEGALKILTTVPSNSAFKDQAAVIGFVAQLCALKKLDAVVADELWSALQNTEVLRNNNDLQSFQKDVFSMLYQKQGDKARAFLSMQPISSLHGRLDIEILDAIEKFVKNPGKGEYDQFLYNEMSSGSGAFDQLHEMRGMYYLQRNQLDKAIAEFGQCSATYQKDGIFFNSSFLDRSIFSESIIQPYYEFDIETQAVTMLHEKYPFLDKKYNLLSYAQTLRDLENRAKNEPAKAAEYYYALASAWYNTGAYGWNRPALFFTDNNGGNSVWWSADAKIDTVKNYKLYDWFSDYYYDANIAAGYLDKAMQAATDRELKARILYLRAKVEKTRNYPLYWWSEEKPEINQKYWDCFKELKTQYANTAYYKEVLRECYDFKNYVN